MALPRSRAPDLLLAGAMAFLAGATDVVGLSRLKDLYVSFMSGNTTQFGLAIGHADWSRTGRIGEIIGLFVLGAALGAVLGVAGGRRHAALVGFAVAAMLALPLLQNSWTVPALVLAMGMQNSALNRIGQTAVSLTYVTGALVKLGRGFGHLLCGRPEGWRWLWQLPMWLSLLAGAMAAAGAQGWIGTRPPWPLAALALAIALVALGHREAAEPAPAAPADRRL